jgi:hypothetical protein
VPTARDWRALADEEAPGARSPAKGAAPPRDPLTGEQAPPPKRVLTPEQRRALSDD